MKITVELDSLAELREFMECKLARIDAPASKTPVVGSGLDHRTVNCLLAERIESVEAALALSDRKLLNIPNFGRKPLAAVRDWPKAVGSKNGGL
jgi:DNA-directed RNA polymerase alpha subunit